MRLWFDKLTMTITPRPVILSLSKDRRIRGTADMRFWFDKLTMTITPRPVTMTITPAPSS